MPPPSQWLGFLGVQEAHLLRCAVSLFWGADLWLQPSWRMSTLQNPSKSWLATKPAYSLVEDASLGRRLPVSGSGCPPPTPTCLSPAGDGLVRSLLALRDSLSPLFCERAWQYLRLGLFVGQFWLSLSFFSLSVYPTVWVAISRLFPQIALRTFRPSPYPK